jgi:hypothetical protein
LVNPEGWIKSLLASQSSIQLMSDSEDGNGIYWQDKMAAGRPKAVYAHV